MNLVYIHTHDSGRYFQPYGYGLATPHIQRLAEEGTFFRHAFCAAPTCSPSRAALLTGMMPHSTGMLGLAHRGFFLQDPHKHLSWFLREHQFDTALSGVQHEAIDATTLGYRRILSAPAGNKLCRRDRDLQNAYQAAAYITESHDKPFFLSFGMSNTHRPYPDHREMQINPDYLLPPWPVSDTQENRADMADYCCALQTVDECVGIVMDALAKSKHEEDTIVLFTTDHGLPWPHMKCTLTDSGIGVALLLKYPGNPLRNRAVDHMVSHIDVFPTLCGLLKLEKPHWLQGVSLLPLLEENKPVRDAVYAEVTYHAAYEPMRSIRTDRYKLIVRYDDFLSVVMANMDPSPAKKRLIEEEYQLNIHPREALYDLHADPVERVNRIGDPRYAAVYHDLLQRLNNWMIATDDPLMTYRHRVPKPNGAMVNLRDSLEPAAKEYEE